MSGNSQRVFYRDGRGTPQDNGEAVRWFRKAAEQGLPDAQCELGDCYRIRKGTSKDFEAAFRWYAKAAEQGHVIAQNNVGVCYEQRLGVTQDVIQAHKWLRLAEDGELKSAKKQQ